MLQLQLRVLVIFMLLHRIGCASMLDWFGWSSPPEEFSSGSYLLDVPFEELGPEDKFLVEASKISGLKVTQLDACQHKLIMKIKSSCGTMSDEELAKLSVNLLNCQADSEGRKTFPCTNEMDLRDCTKDMEPEMWNAYHIMSNRARAVCYIARQEQFRALAEITINKLVSTTRSHLEHMSLLNDNQDKLQKATQIALERISNSQHNVLSTYSRLKRLEKDITDSLIEGKFGLEQLLSLIDEERSEITKAVTDFKKALDENSQEIIKQKKMKSVEHEKVLRDLIKTQVLIQDMNVQLGEITSLITQFYEKSSAEFQTSFKHLASIDSSLNDIYNRINFIEKIFESKTNFVLSYIGSDGENIDGLLISLFELLCLSWAMIISSFIDLPKHTRCLILICIIGNICMTHYFIDYSVDAATFYLSLVSVILIDLALIQVYKFTKKNYLSKNAFKSTETKIKERKTTEHNGLHRTWIKVDDWLLDHGQDYLKKDNFPLTPESDANEILSQSSKHSEKFQQNMSHSHWVSGSSSGKKTCSATRTNGLRCKLRPIPGRLNCRIHEYQR